MPEGPSILLLREEASRFNGSRVLRAEGGAPDAADLRGLKLLEAQSWGKHFLLRFARFALRIHFGLFGSHSIDTEKPGRRARLGLHFREGSMHFYACSIRRIGADLDALYDWSADVLSPHWDPAAAMRKLAAMPKAFACDALLDQDVFAGVGNIIKNEVLFRIRVHPLSRVGALPARSLRALVHEAQEYSEQFLDWKREGTLKRHWLAHTKSSCPRCRIPLKLEILGRTKRRTFFCERCQLLHR